MEAIEDYICNSENPRAQAITLIYSALTWGCDNRYAQFNLLMEIATDIKDELDKTMQDRIDELGNKPFNVSDYVTGG